MTKNIVIVGDAAGGLELDFVFTKRFANNMMFPSYG